MREAVDKKLFSGFLMGKNNEAVSILQYADDTIFFGEATMQNMKAIKIILRSFELASSLKINFAKNCFGAIGKSDQWRKEDVEYLNCSMLSMSFMYLGIPIGANPRRNELWDPIIRKVPTKVVNKLVSIQRRFLWGGGMEQRKIAWVKWETVCLPKDKRGLGIKDLKTFNTTLLGKWRWDLFQQHGELWAKIMDSKYGGWRSLDEGIRGSNESPWWKDLMMVIH
ncbi:uncharacterized protein LOC114371809 [Glycine soja]|uniref:uncharacterized protein LOC114371809 n=1 Tax=Glycine soja TaxID=3848 RepID=UPI00103BBE58|nr:uncharacterized protein LOC114371809 [Glycine soja]